MTDESTEVADAPADTPVQEPLARVSGKPLVDLPKDLYIPPDALAVFLEAFEGPLDLLLYLIRRQNMNILDIDVSEITRQYMDYIGAVEAMRFELAAEYLVMAATLAEIDQALMDQAAEAGHHLQHLQSNAEYELIERIHGAPAEGIDFILFNPAAFTHTSVALRDALLAVSGTLDCAMGGSLLEVKNRDYLFDHTSQDKSSYEIRRRSIYVPVIRNHLYDMFQLFDYTDASVMTGDRATTTVAPQALFLLNSDLVERVSRSLASSTLAADAADDAERIDRIYERILGRPASTDDLNRCASFLKRVRGILPPGSGPVDAFSALCHVLLASNEFIYLK
mgnify:CR=1 FL=1